MLTLNVNSANQEQSGSFIVGDEMEIGVTVATDFAYDHHFDFVFKECSTVPADSNDVVIDTDADGNSITAFIIMDDSCPMTNFLKRKENNGTSFTNFVMKAFKYPDYPKSILKYQITAACK